MEFLDERKAKWPTGCSLAESKSARRKQLIDELNARLVDSGLPPYTKKWKKPKQAEINAMSRLERQIVTWQELLFTQIELILEIEEYWIIERDEWFITNEKDCIQTFIGLPGAAKSAEMNLDMLNDIVDSYKRS